MSLYDRLRAALESGQPGPFHDVRTASLEAGEIMSAAVLVAITERDDPGVILTQRPEWLRRHAGQVAFPGGRIDPDDADAVAAALREAEEEIGLPPDAVRVVGTAAPYLSGSGFHITPVLGLVTPDLTYVPCPEEVDSIFEVPLAFLLDPANSALKYGEWKGVAREYRDIQWQDRRIWGVTAAIIYNLSHQLGWPSAPE